MVSGKSFVRLALETYVLVLKQGFLAKLYQQRFQNYTQYRALLKSGDDV
jgi:hypothetical protein